jgi:hypothetical protein
MMSKTHKRSIAIAAILAAALSSTSANASNVDVGINVGTLGVGPTIGLTIIPNRFDARLATGFFNYSHDVTSSDMNYSGHLNLRNAALLADFHPFAGTFRLTAGAVLNKNAFSLDGKPAAGTTYTSDGHTYTAQAGDSVNANVDFKNFAPYIGIGWGNNDMEPGLHFTADLGAMYQGSPTSTISIRTADPIAQAQADQYASNAQSQLNSDLQNWKWYPVVQAGLLYRF